MKLRFLLIMILSSLTLLSCQSNLNTESSPNNGLSAGSCGTAAVSLSQQVANPIKYLSSNNNGLTLQFPYISTTYANDVTGYAIFGVATQSNNSPISSTNIPSGTTFNTLDADPNLDGTCYVNFKTSWGGQTICGFIDSGTNELVFPNLISSPISVDTNPNDITYSFYTPATPTTFSATNIGFGGSPSIATPFTIENVNSHISNYNVFSQVGVLNSGGPISGDFDWGLPFFLGRTVFIGLEGASSSLGSGLYWSYPTTLNTANLSAPSGPNVMPVHIGGYGNEPYVSVTVCVPGTNNCATIPNVLLDTGSSGLRLFASAFPNGFANQLSGTGNGECVSYGDNSVQWGAVQIADIRLGQQTAGSVPIHIISNSYGDGGASCYDNLAQIYKELGYVSGICPITTTASDSSDPSSPNVGCPYFDSPSTNFNGILGVNFLAQDCGPACANTAQNPMYYSCH